MIEVKFDKLLKKLGKNASEIAVETGINRNTINSLVNKKLEGIRFSTLEKLCQTYNLKISDIIELKLELQASLPRTKTYKQEAEMVPFTIWPGMVALSQISISGNGQTQDFGRMDAYFQEHYMVAYWDYEAMNKFAKLFYAKYGEQDEFERYFSEYLISALEIENLYETLSGQGSVYESDIDLGSVISKIEKAYTNFWIKSFFIETFDAGYDQEVITGIAKKHNLTKKEVEILTTPDKLTLDNQRKLAFLAVISKWMGKKEPLSKSIEKDRQVVEEYKRKFDFYRSNYAQVFHVGDKNIIAEAKTALVYPRTLKTEMKHLTAWEVEHKKEIDAIIRKHRLQTNPLGFFNTLTFFREHRKTVNQKGFHVLDFILSNLEIKTGISKQYLKFLSFEEIEEVLRGLVSRTSLKQRFNQGILVSINYSKKGEIKVFEDHEAKSIAEDLEREYSQTVGKENVIKGITAAQGFASGTAKIILTEKDFDNFHDGEILVTGMTRPHFLPLIEKAKAIVTDEGGLSSHAAVVSRNLGIPCVIGTQNATKIIKNGDHVEVRASDGTVRILK